jgi:hypothetical protein
LQCDQGRDPANLYLTFLEKKQFDYSKRRSEKENMLNSIFLTQAESPKEKKRSQNKREKNPLKIPMQTGSKTREMWK